MSVENEILSSIDNINMCIQEASLDVLDATVKEYNKLSQFVEFTVFDESVVMEGKILDEATGKNTFDGFFKKVILFIPRLLAAIVKSIASVFTNDYEKDMKENKDKGSENLNNENDPQKLETARENVMVVSKGNMNFDPKTKHFFLVDKFKHIKNYIRILTGILPLMKKIRTIHDGGKTTYGTLAREIKAIIKGEATMDEAFGLTADALYELAIDSNRAARAIRGIADETSMHLQKQMEKDYNNGKDITKKAEMKDLADQISEISAIIGTVSFFGRAAHFLGKDLGGGSIFLRKIRSKLAYDKEEDVALMNADTKKKELNSRIKANKRAIARTEDDMKRLDKKDKEILKLEKKNAKLTKKLDDKRLENQASKEFKQDQQDEFWGRESEPVEESTEIEVPANNTQSSIKDSMSEFKDSLLGRTPITDREKKFYKKFDKFFHIPNIVEDDE